jgi:hypothetical protein
MPCHEIWQKLWHVASPEYAEFVQLYKQAGWIASPKLMQIMQGMLVLRLLLQMDFVVAVHSQERK